MSKVLSRMARILGQKAPADKPDPTPVELPAGARVLPSIAQEIQDQIAIQIALKQAREDQPLQTVDQIKAELLDLDDEEGLPPSFSQFEYIDMVDELEPFHGSDESAPQGARDSDEHEAAQADRESEDHSEEDRAT